MSMILSRQSITHGLFAATQNLLLLGRDGSAQAALDAAVSVPADQLVVNQGLISTTAPNTAAINIASLGIVLNSGTVSASAASSNGIRIGRVGVVVNSGLVSGGHDGLDLAGGGFVVNRAGGRIDGAGSGIVVSGGAGTISNAGTIAGEGGTGLGVAGGLGIDLLSGGAVTNSGTISGGAGADIYSITSKFGTAGTGGVGLSTADGARITNDGTILGGPGGAEIAPVGYSASGYSGAGGTGVILAGATLINAGVISGGAGGDGDSALGSGASGGIGVFATQAPGSVLNNSGLIEGGRGGFAEIESDGGSGALAVNFAAFGTVINSGTISAGLPGNYASGGDGIVLEAGGRVINSGLITGSSGAPGLFSIGSPGGIGVVLDASGTVTNTGSIYGGGYGGSFFASPGVALAAGGSVVNGAGGVIAGVAASGNSTIIDAGTIRAIYQINTDNSYAISFSGSFADRVILDPGAVLEGQVVGGSGTNTLELAAAPGVTGTVSAFGSEFTDFGTITLDKGANWLLDGASPTGQGVTLAGGGHVLSLNDTAGFSDPISGFASTDALDLRDVAYAAGANATLSGSRLTVISGTTTDTLTLLGLNAGTGFAVSNDGTGHVLIDETVSPTAGRTASASPRFLASTAAATAPPHAVFSAQVSQSAMADSLHGFMRPGAASATWSASAVSVAHAVALHVLSAPATQLAGFDQGNRDSAHPTLLHHAN